MPVVKGTIVSSDDSPTPSPSISTAPLSTLGAQNQTPLPALQTYLRGGVGLGLAASSVSRSHSPLPGSSPVATSPVGPGSGSGSDSDSEEVDEVNVTPIAQTTLPALLPPLSSDGLVYSDPIIGTKEERKAKARQKGQTKRMETLTARKVETAESSEANKVAVFEEILDKLSSSGLTFGQLMLYVFDPTNKKGAQRGQATQILNFWVSNKNSKSAREEVGAWAEEFIEDAMREEAKEITESQVLQTTHTTVDHDYNTGRIAMKMLAAFATSSRNLKNSLDERVRKRFTIITSAALTLLGEYSHRNNFSRRILGLYLYATGAQRQTISVMSHLGISEGYQSLTHKPRVMINRRPRGVKHDDPHPPAPPSTPPPEPSVAGSPQAIYAPPDAELLTEKIKALEKVIKPGTLQELSLSMRSLARGVASTGLFAAAYDNINLMFRAAEQVMGRTDSQENGTCATIFPLWKAAADQMRIADLDAAFLSAPPLTIDDILLTHPEIELMDKCLRHCVLRIIVEHGGERFKRFRDDVDNSLPITSDKIELHTTTIHPLPAWMIDESTIIGNAEVAHAIYTELEVRGLSHWNWIVKILCGDQLSIARLRSLLNIRAGHEGGYSGFGWGVWMPGLFHGKIADMHGFFVTHWGVPHRGTRNPGSLSFHNTHLHRSPIVLTSLPPFRVCRDLVFVSLYARVLHCLLLVSGKASLEECADSIKSFAELEAYAASIYSKFANAELVGNFRWQRQRAEGNDLPTPGDEIFENSSLLLCDALISREFTDSIKAGDSGRVVLVLKLLALSFRGNGRSKYAYEMLHLIHNLTHVWPKAIRNIVLNNWLVNPTGKPFSWVEVDLMQEHMNFWIKTIYKAHGSAASWEWLGMVAPCVTALRHLSTSIINILGSDQGTKHAPPDLSTDIELLMDSLAEHDVYQVKGRRFAEGDGSPTPDVIAVGIQQLTDSSSNALTEYNAAFCQLQARRRLRPLVSTWLDSAETSEPASPVHANSTSVAAPSGPVDAATDVEMAVVDSRSDSGGSEESVDYFEGDDFDTEQLTAFERAMDEVDEPTLTRDSADDVALDMDGGDSGFIGNDLEMDMYEDLEDAGFIVDDVDTVDYT
ncbi:hypothetical protein FB45DRAFT_992097 [Roridomyces roridus]|uniref:DUF6589 domain-containing protein n=1 Tax=Roridomyces roridus TaxID=1738132 RepID=A0AAD7BJ02_9AGAR|nr:hypothetical protein FB45DRAFT_992097 [Roridomyces roridus]